jgi:hypothetical protein
LKLRSPLPRSLRALLFPAGFRLSPRLYHCRSDWAVFGNRPNRCGRIRGN